MIRKVQGKGHALHVKRTGGALAASLQQPEWSVESELKRQVEELRRLYEAGAQQQRRAEQLSEASPFPLLLLDADGIVRWCNPAGSDLLLPPGAELAGKRLLLFVTPGSFTAFRAHLLACFQGEGVPLTYIGVRRQDGRVRQLAVESRRVQLDDRGAPAVLLAAFDYTDTLSREARDRRQQQALLQLSEQLLDGQAITSRTEIVQAVLACALQLTDADSAYWAYRDGGQQKLESLRWPGDKDRALADTMAARARQKGQTFLVSDYQAWPAKMKITPFTSVQAAMAVLADLGEQVKGELVVFSLTPGKQIDPEDAALLERLVRMARLADEALTARLAAVRFGEQNKRLHQLARLGVFSWPLAAQKAQWDELFAKMTGLDPYGDRQQEGGNALLHHVHPADLKLLQQMIRDWRNGLPAINEIRFVGQDGGERWVQLAGEETGDPREVPEISGFGLDITDFKLAEKRRIDTVRQELEKLQVEQVMASVVSLTDCLAEPVKWQKEITEGLLYWVEREGAGKATALADSLHRLQAWTEQTDYQLRRLQAYSFYGMGVSLDKRRQDLGGLVAEWLTWQDSRFRAAGVTVDWRRMPGSLYVMVDRRRFMEALTELLDNALESFAVHATPAPQLIIRLMGDAERVELVLHDNGPGFAPERLHDLFQPFKTVGGDGRLGIGLSLVRHVVQLHQGMVLANNAPAGGAIVTIMLPTVL